MAPPYDIRPIEPVELPAFLRVDATAFGESTDPADVDAIRSTFEFDRSLAVFDGGHIVATTGAYSFSLTLTGATTILVPGVSWVAVLPTHRRRGLLTALMRRQLDDVRARGEAVAALWASESSIYGRFGYGIAASAATYELDPRYGRFARPHDTDGRLTLMDREGGAAEVLPAVYERARLGQPGALSRGRARWDNILRDPERRRDGASEMFHVVYEESDGQQAGYASYRIRTGWTDGFSASTLLIREIVALTSEAHTALWRYLLDVDLIVNVRYAGGPVDEPLRWLLADSRRLRMTRRDDSLWLRIVDVPAVLGARRYAVPGRIVLDVADAFCAQTAGRYALEAGPDGAICRRTTEAPDLRLDVADLGAIYLGGVRPSLLARAGRVAEVMPGALRRADLMFASEPLPWCCTMF